MAARWGAGEEILTACNTNYFSMETLCETTGFGAGEALEPLQGSFDSSILSIFEEAPAETKGLDDESETTLLTALTEILDNMDDESLSPFDTLPDADLLSAHRGRELSPLRRMFCLSHSPEERDSLCKPGPFSSGESLSEMLANSAPESDGEEDGSLTLSIDKQAASLDGDLQTWRGLTLPASFEHEDDGSFSVSLGDLVRHMHPYCMAISVESEEGEQMLPEGGILLEVVDQGENGEPILAVPNMDISFPLKQETFSGEAGNESSDSSEHIVVDDEDDDALVKTNCEAAASHTPVVYSSVNHEVLNKAQKEKKRKNHSKKKMSKKSHEDLHPKKVERRVLRSATLRRAEEKSQKKPDEESKKVPQASNSPSPLINHKEETKPKRCEERKTNTPQLLEVKDKIVVPCPPKTEPTPEMRQSACPVGSQPSSETPKQIVNVLAPETPKSTTCPDVTGSKPPVDGPPAAPEPKPKSLSLEEYRRLRQQKKPAPVEKEGKTTKWPSLPELPKELPPIPYLPDPNPKDPRRTNPQARKTEVEEVKPAWQPRGPAAPPTPEALLVPPAYMMAPSSKPAVTALRPEHQKTSEPATLPERPQAATPNSQNNPTTDHTSTRPAQPHVSQGVASPCSSQLQSSGDENCSAISGRKDLTQTMSPNSVHHTKVCPETTTDVLKPARVSGSASNVQMMHRHIQVEASTSLTGPDGKSSKRSDSIQQPTPPPPAASKHLDSCSPTTQQPTVPETKGQTVTTGKPQKGKSATQELIETFTSEMGIEAADLTSLLEQFEKTQAKEEKCEPEVSGRAAAVGNSRPPEHSTNTVFLLRRAKLLSEKIPIDHLKLRTLPAALAPQVRPLSQMWKPLSGVSSLGMRTEASKLSPSKVIQIEAQPLPPVKICCQPTSAAASVSFALACMDHDYCLPSETASTGEPGKRWNVKQQPLITIKPFKQQTPTMSRVASLEPAAKPAGSGKDFSLAEEPEEKCDGSEEGSVVPTPDASPTQKESPVRSSRRLSQRSYRRYAASRSPSPGCSPRGRSGRQSRKRSYRSPSPVSSCSETYSSRSRSRSKSPAKKRYRHRRSDSSSDSSSRSSSRSSLASSHSPPRRRRYSYSSSRSGSWSRSRSRSSSPQRQSQWIRRRRLCSPSYRPKYHCAKPSAEEVKRRKERAIEERRVVYVGRIRGTMTQKELKERFSMFGEIEECTLHFRDHGDNYGFVTYYDTKDAFTAIENGSKLRKPDELPFDLCFGGRRQFCQSSYADLDSNREYDPLFAKAKYHALDFDTLLKQAQQNLKR